MAQVLAKYIKGLDIYIPGDVRAMSLTEYKELEKGGYVERAELLEEVYQPDEIERDELKGQNILGQKYKKGIVDVVIPTMDSKGIKSLKLLKKFQAKKKISLEIIVRKFSPKVGGFAKACNDGARLNKGLGEFVLFLNDDVEIEGEFFKNLIKSFEDKTIGMVGTFCSQTSWGINGSVMCIRRELFEMIGGFDNQYFFMFEDNDLCDNVRLRGYDIAISGAESKHEGGESINTQSEFWRKNYYTGLNYYNQKWKNKNRIIGSMIIGDENGRYMSRVILDLFKRGLIDELVAVCDKSNKETVKELEELKKYYLIDIKYHDFKLFGKAENLLRERAIQYAISKNPLGIITLDCDEFFDEELNRNAIHTFLNQGIAFDFPLAHYWGDENSVRIDGAFSSQKNVRLFRFCPEESQKFYDRNLHCGSVPIYAYKRRKITDYILKHFGYIKKSDVEEKKKRQEKFDKKMLLENPDLYQRMTKEGKVIDWNKSEYLKIWKK